MISGILLLGLGLLWFLAIWYKWDFPLGATKMRWGRDAFGERGAACVDYIFAVGCVLVGLLLIAINYGG